MSDIIYKQSPSKSKVYFLLRSIHERPASAFYKSTYLPFLQKKAMAIDILELSLECVFRNAL